MKRLATTVLASALAATLAGTAFGQTIDGVADPAYGPALAIQDTETGFGDSNLGQVDFANGSELDGAFGLLTGGALYLVFAGNLESNFNKLEIFIDSKPGGENRLLMTNSNQGGFLRMADDGSGNGLTFETGFDADYWVSPTGGGTPYALYVDYVEIGTGAGYYLGQGQAGGVGGGVLVGGNAPSGGGSLGVLASIDNSTTAGVLAGGCPPAAGNGAGVSTGFEVAIPLSAIGDPTGCVNVVAFVNGSSHDYMSNQVMPAATGACNLADPRFVNFNQYTGVQYFTVCPSPTSATHSTWGRVKTIYR